MIDRTVSPRLRLLAAAAAVVLVVACETELAPTPPLVPQVTPAASGEPAISPRPGPTPVPPDLAPGATMVAAGRFHACALLARGTVACWGENRTVEADTGGYGIVSTPVEVPGVANLVKVDAGDSFTCALRRSGSVWCWGANNAGVFGDAPRAGARPAPQRVPGIHDAIDLGVGERHSCVVLRNGGVRCWGVNFQGQLGDGTRERRLRRVKVEAPSKAIAISAGGAVTCALLVDRTVACWGENNIFGSVGDGGMRDRLVPTPVLGVTDATQIAAGGTHACALLEDGTVRCWGANFAGQIGSGDDGPGRYRTPIPVEGLDGVVAIAAGEYTTCAVDADGRAWCWGLNQDGQLGSEGIASSSLPVQVTGLTGATGITTESGHSCAVTVDLQVWCWGSNDVGQLGRGDPVGSGTGSSVPVQVVGLGGL